ncbi:unnamed protein product [Bursaphelenchus okinawaensis]|uniref:Glycosyltransferase family 92 protein n=1 Tax=Bursaphelenchus okinawaensis TaxID=465554 RepID=A0A811KD10_9BILA|nr:unnamed protein product [Bursaphelenchus okinawaensis]CAG9101345.1 unnamed protein product [Bursaphelenchus okinawaensis]
MEQSKFTGCWVLSENRKKFGVEELVREEFVTEEFVIENILIWFVYTGKSRGNPVPNIFIGSAHLVDYQNTATPFTVILNTMSDDAGSLTAQDALPLYCLSDKNEKVKTSFRKSDKNRYCSWKDYYIQCDFKQPVDSIQLIDSYGDGIEVSVTKPIQKTIPLVACLSRLFYYDNWQTALVVLEMYHAMGVNEMSIHVINVIQEIYTLLEFYKNEINLKIHPGIVAPQIAGQDPNKNNEAMNQLLCYNECLFNYREAAEFIVFSDMDELITSAGGNLYDTVKRAQLRNPLAAAFEFMWKTSSYANISLRKRTANQLWCQREPTGRVFITFTMLNTKGR